MMNPDVRASWEAEQYDSQEPAVAIREGEFPTSESWWRRVARWSLYAIAFLAPLLFLSYTIPPTFIKQVAVSVLAFVAFISWLGESLLSGRVYYKRSLINLALGALLLALFLATLFSPQALHGLIGSDDTGERFASFLVFAVIFFVAGGVFYTEKESRRLVWWLLGGGFLLSVLTLVQFFAPSRVPFSALARVDVNPVGTVNGVATVLGFYLVFAAGVLATAGAALRNAWIRVGLVLLVLTTLASLVVVNFRSVWIALAAALIVLLGLQFRLASHVSENVSFLRRRGFAVLFLLLALAIFFILANATVVRVEGIPLEVSPPYRATIDIAKQTLKGDVLFGSGPGTFGLDYSLFRDPSTNLTTFWGVRFNSGIAFMPTVLATAGVLGALALTVFSLVTLVSLLRAISKRTDEDPFLAGGMAAVVFGLLIWWLYMPTFTLQVVLFVTLGVLIARLNEVKGEEHESWWRIAERSVTFTTPWATFVTSLAIIFLMVGGVAFLYYTIQQYAAAVYLTRGASKFSVAGDVEGALADLNRAVSLSPDNDGYYRFLSQVALAKVQQIINTANTAQNPNLLADFQAAVSNTITFGQKATQINPNEALNWSTLGLVYQSLVPFIDGAESAALGAHDKAIQFDPQNPTHEFNRARTYLALADRTQSRLNQPGITNQAALQLTKQRTETLDSARSALEKSVQLKPDYPQANYFLAQVLIVQGNLTRAIQQVETVRSLAPFDIGVAFQLGVLYYQAGDFPKAEAEFLRAIAINENYSNARYFFGLLLDRRGEKTKALDQFLRIQALNPDNQEVKTIMANLRAGKAALDGISPPAPPPTERREPPVSDAGESRN
ncbi:MAG: tetratricopeptide repeat protein [Candidatus Sungbacteria bacterium]|uniref:Tetratricopeptide repeat protein n=1 Tax=Candidatus Sungiibacteriota bacterium TaxID=2750080 RepID=A0A931SBP9_9BACT|nr:tetratricopeptide repeat protein [Candidatus Sungbacteria bacterium]